MSTTPNAPILEIETAGGTVYGMLLETRRDGSHLYRLGSEGWSRVHSEIRSIREISDDEYRERLEGAVVVVPKYGRRYRGRVVEVARTRAVVRFTTAGGTVKQFSFPIREVGIVR